MFLNLEGLIGMAIVGGAAAVAIGGLVGLGVALSKKWQLLEILIATVTDSEIFARIYLKLKRKVQHTVTVLCQQSSELLF